MMQLLSSHTVTLTPYLKKINIKLTNVNDWPNANKLLLNVERDKYSFFHKSSQIGNIPLRPSNLNINGLTVGRESSIKFLGSTIDEI